MLEMGKPFEAALKEVDGTAETLEYHAKNAKQLLAGERLKQNGVEMRIDFAPSGVWGVITPWNYPFSIPFDAIAPCLLLGNTLVLKPAESTTLTGLELKKVLARAGLPKGVISTIVGGEKTGRVLVKSDVNGIFFVGSTAAGKNIFLNSAPHLHKLVLELGGSDPAIVCGDVDANSAAAGVVRTRFNNCGQVCCAAKRVFVDERIAKKFVSMVVEKTRSLKVGSGLTPKVDVGPLSSKAQLKLVETQVADAVKKGARVLVGGRRLKGKGFFFKPTVLVGVKKNMRVMREEVFGPVMPIASFKKLDDAIKEANNTSYGLGAYIWTSNKKKALEIAERLEAGTVWTNGWMWADSCPWGGTKQSGFGRTGGRYGVESFSNIKTVYLRQVK
ncbi:aldehyde dehydrogenase family protein [Candidatus Micrarchaeota archaeon]|nr:aldehyde dehydrogenase family protein [Candidatus Micrarchaeota archaeon]